MADEKLVEELATVMHTACDGADCDCPPNARGEFEECAKVALEWLAERGRLTPDGSKVREIPGVRLTWSDGKVEEFQRIAVQPEPVQTAEDQT